MIFQKGGKKYNKEHDIVEKLQILMSTYNGKKYLREQLDSILAQDCEEKGTASLSLLVRDDGSTDGTQAVLGEYSEKYPGKISWYQGVNTGVIKSFFDLLANAGEADYYALADQDDYWFAGKMDAGIRKIRQMDRHWETEAPLLYCCRPALVDEKLKPLAVNVDNPVMRPGFGNALVENIVTGCTTVFNNKMRQMLILKVPEHATMHDRWMYLIATCFGSIYYDEKPYIYYRQHGGNAVGKNTEKFSELIYRIKKIKKDSQSSSRQAVEFLQVFKGVSRDILSRDKEDKTGNKATDGGLLYGRCIKSRLYLLKIFIKGKKSIKSRIKLLKTGKLYRQRKLDNRIFKLLILLNLY